MKIFSIGLFLLLVFETLEGSTIPLKRSSRTLNTSFITDFNGTYQRKDPCTNTEVETSTYKASHEFHHQSHDTDWTDYTLKCSSIIKGFLQAITDLLASKCQQNSTFNFNINTTVSQNSDNCLLEGENGTKCFSPKITIETSNYEIPSSDCQNYRVVNCIGEYRGGTNQEEVKKIQISGRKYKCFPVCDEEKTEEIEITKPKVSEDEVCTEAPEQEKQMSSQALSETLLVESTPSNPEFQQIPLTKTTEITEVDEIISPETEKEFVLSTTFAPSFDTFESQTETVTDTEAVENIKESVSQVEIFPTTSTYYDEELKKSEKLETQLPVTSFEFSASPTPVVQIPTEIPFEVDTETVTAKTTEEISTGDLINSEIPVTIPPQPTTLSKAYTEEIVQNVYYPTPEPASQITISRDVETQFQTPQLLADQTSAAPLVPESNVPLFASPPPQFETLSKTDITLPLADQITPENQSQTESVVEEVYEVETSTSQPPSPVVVEAPVFVPQTKPQPEPSEDQTPSEFVEETEITLPLADQITPENQSQTESVVEEVYEVETSTSQPPSPVVVEAPVFVPETEFQPKPSKDQTPSEFVEQTEITLPLADQITPENQSQTESVFEEVYKVETSTSQPPSPVVVEAPVFVPETEFQPEPSEDQTPSEFVEQTEITLPLADQITPENQSQTESVFEEVYEVETSTSQPPSPVVVEAPVFVPQTKPQPEPSEDQTPSEFVEETEITLPLADQITPENQSQTESVFEEVYEVETSTSQPPSPAIVETPVLVPQPEPQPKSSEDQTLSEFSGEKFTVQNFITQKPQIIPEVQPDIVALKISEPSLDSTTTEKLETEVCEDESAFTSTFLPSVPQPQVTQVEENDYELFQKEAFQEYASTPLPFIEQSDYYQEDAIETVSLPPEVESLPESTFLTTQAPTPKETYSEKVVISVENDETSVTQPFPQTSALPFFPSEKPYITTSNTSNESLKEDVYVLEPEQNVAVKPSTSLESQTISEDYGDYETSTLPNYDVYGQLSNKNFREIQADSLVTDAAVEENFAPQVEPDISIEASAVPVPEHEMPCVDELTSNDTLTTLSSNLEETVEIYNENLSTPFPFQPQSPSVNDKISVSLESNPQFIDSNQESKPNIFVPITEQPDVVTKNIEVIEKDTFAKEYNTPAPPVQSLELMTTPQPQPSKTTFFEEEIIETKTPVFETASSPVVPTEIATLTNPHEEKQSLSLSESIVVPESNNEQKTIEEEPYPVTLVPEITSPVSDQTFYTPLVSEPEGDMVPEYPYQSTIFNKHVAATEYDDYSTLEPKVPQNEYVYETQEPFEVTTEVPTTQSPLIDESTQKESLFEVTSTSEIESITDSEVPELFTQPPVIQDVVNSELQTLATESQVSEFVEEQDITSSIPPQIPTTSSSKVEESFFNASETESPLPSVSEEFSTFNEFSDFEVSTVTPEQTAFYALGTESNKQKQKETVVVSEAEIKVPEEQSKPFVPYEPEFPAEQPEIPPVWPSLETQSQTENLTYSQDIVTEQYQPNNQQFEISTPYSEEQFESIPTTQPEEPCENEETFSQSQAGTEAIVNYSDTLSDQNTNQSQLDLPQNLISTQPPQMQHKPFVDFDEFTTPTPGMTVYEDQPFAIKYQTSIGPQTETDTTTSYFEEDIINTYSTTTPSQPLPVDYSEQKIPFARPETQNLFKQTFNSDKSETSRLLEQQKEFTPSTPATYKVTSAPFYNQETDYSYSETSSTSSASEFDYYSEPFVPTLSPEEETLFKTSITEQAETFEQKPQTPAEISFTELEEGTQSLQKLTDEISNSDVLDEQVQVPIASNTEKEIVESYDQDFITTTTTPYKSGTESTVNSQTKVVEEIDNSPYEPLTTTPSTDVFLPTKPPSRPDEPCEEDSFEKKFQSQSLTTVSQNTEEPEIAPVEEPTSLPDSETSADFELAQTSEIDDEQFTKSFSTIPPQVQYPFSDLESSSLLSDQLSQTNFEDSFSKAFSTTNIPEQQPLETIPEQPCLDCEISDSKFIKSLPENSKVPEEPCLDCEQTEEVNYEASTFKPNFQTFETKSPRVVQTETVEQFSTTNEELGTTPPQIEIDIYLPSKTTQHSALNETVESITTTAPQKSDMTTSYLEKEQKLYNFPSTLASQTQSELSTDYVEKTPEVKTSISEFSNPSSEVFEQYSDINNFSQLTTSSFQEIDSIETTQTPQEKPIPAYDDTLLTVPSASQTSFSNYEDENLSYDNLTQQTQPPELVTSFPLSQTEEEPSSPDNYPQQFVTPSPITEVVSEETCFECEPSNPVVADGQTEILENSDYDYEEITTNPPSSYEPNFVPLLTEKAEEKAKISETKSLKEFIQPTTTPYYDEAIENQSSFTQEVFESQDEFKSTSVSAENTPYVTVTPKTEPQFTSFTKNLQSNEFLTTPLPSAYAPTSEKSVLSDFQSVKEEECEECEEKTYSEKPLDITDQDFNNEYVTSETLTTETLEDTSLVPESRTVPIPADEQALQPLTPKPKLSPTVFYDELPQIVEQNSQDSFYNYNDFSTTTTSNQEQSFYDNESPSEPELLEEQGYPGYFQQFNVKNTVSDSLVTEKVANEQPSMIYDTTLSPESASESFQTVVQLNSTFTSQPQPTNLVNEPVHHTSFLPAQPQLSTEHLSTASETLTTPIPKSNEEPCDDTETDIVTTSPVVSGSQFTENFNYNEESNDFVTKKPEFTPEILVTQTTPNSASQSQSVVSDEIVSTDTYFSPTSTALPVELSSSQQTENNFSTEKQFSEIQEEVTTEKPQAATVPLPMLYSLTVPYPVNSSQTPTEMSPLLQSQTKYSASSLESQPEAVLFYDSKTITTNQNFSSTPTPSQVLNEVSLASPLQPKIIPEPKVSVIPQTNKFVELDEEIITITKAPETRPESLATVDVVTSPLPPQPKQVVEVDEEILITNKNSQPVKTVTSATAKSATLPQNLPPNLLYFEEEIVTTKTPSSSVPQTSIPLEPSTILPTTPQTLAFPPLSQKIVEVDREIITSKYPATVTSQPPTTPIVFDEKFVSQTLYSTPLTNEAKKVEKEIIIENNPTASQEQYVTPSFTATLPPEVTTSAPVPLPKKFTEVDEEIFVANKQSTPDVASLLLTSLAPPSLPQGISEVDEEVIITNQPISSQVQSSLPAFLQPVPSSIAPKAVDEKIVLTNEQTASQTNSFDKNVTPANTILPSKPEPKKFVEVDQEIVITSKQPASQTTIPSFVQPLIPLETTLTSRPVSNEFKEVDEEIIITTKPAESQEKTITPSLIGVTSPVTTTLVPSSTKKFMEVDEEIIVSGQKPVPTLPPFFIPPGPTSLPSEPSPKKFMEVDEEIIITNKPTTPQLLTTPSPVPSIVSSTSVPPTEKVVEFDREFIITNNNPTSPSLLKYSDDLSQIQSSGIALSSSSSKPQTQPEKLTYFNQEVITTTGTPNTVPLQTDAYVPLQPIQTAAPQLQSQTVDYFEQQPQSVDYFEQQPQIKTFEAESPEVTSLPTVTPQEMYPNAGVSVAQVDTSSYDLVPEQTIPSSKPGEDSFSCCSGSSAPLLCPFNPALKGNMSAPSYYILVSKIPHPSGNGEQSFQVEKVFLGDGTPLNCTLTEKTFPTSLYKPIPIASSRPVTLQTTYDNS